MTVTIRVAGILVAIAAVALCAKTLAGQWSHVEPAIRHANLVWLVVGLLCSAAAMFGLGVLWWRSLQLFGSPAPLHDAVAWYFGGELGKYLPGGVWPVLGRGELAYRAGKISRGKAYATTLISYAAMCIAAAIVCGALVPFLTVDGHGLGWGWLTLMLIPLGLIVVHPAVMGPLLSFVRRLSHGRVELEPQSWRAMIRLIGISIPTWLFVGAASVAGAEALGFHQQPAQVAFAAVAAWIIGFLVVPVPAGAGLRELIFVAISGLDAAPAIAVAALARLLLMVVDAIGGVGGLWSSRRTLIVAKSAVNGRIDRPRALNSAEGANGQG